jgi:uncharacterized protein
MNELNVQSYDDVADFLRVAGTWLEKEEAKNGLMLGLAGNIAAGRQTMTDPPVMITVCTGGDPQAALLMTVPPRFAGLYAPRGQVFIEAILQAVLDGGHEVRGCVGPVGEAEVFARQWESRTGQRASLKTAQRIYELRKVVPSRPVPGRLRPATMADLDLAARWRHEFSTEAMGEDDAPAARFAAERSIGQGQLFVWDRDGVPVSQAVATRPTRHGIAIGAVYTPPEYRNRGYASAAVAALSQLQLDAGRQFCTLYTDLANPASNSIYQKIGYVPVADSSHYVFCEGAENESRLRD